MKKSAQLFAYMQKKLYLCSVNHLYINQILLHYGKEIYLPDLRIRT